MPSERAIPVVSRLRGRVEVPSSKSLTQRALIAASLAPGRSRIVRPLEADDSRLLVAALNVVGVAARWQHARGGAPELVIDGSEGVPASPASPVQAGNAGTTMRFLTARLAAGERECVIDGSDRMRQRPIEDLLQALRSLGARAASIEGDGCPPVRVGGEGLRGGEARLPGARSSQYLSALLLAAPAAVAGLDLIIDGDLVSRPYVDLTIDVMGRFGVEVEATRSEGGEECFRVAPGQQYRPTDYEVEGDYSAASYFFAAAAITAGRVEVAGLTADSRQGDAAFLDLLERMGCVVERRAGAVVVQGPPVLRGIDADLGRMPDVAPTLAAVALHAQGPTRISGASHLRLKESDRIAALVDGIGRLGGEATAAPDGLTITPRALSGAPVETFSDHRMAMAFAIAGLRIPGTVILDPGCVSKSFPAFWEALERLISGA
jgi:3-phosphoshikimate 1-carboxyvinyltransferase